MLYICHYDINCRLLNLYARVLLVIIGSTKGTYIKINSFFNNLHKVKIPAAPFVVEPGTVHATSIYFTISSQQEKHS